MTESHTYNRVTRRAAWIRHLSAAPIGLALLCTGPLSAPAQSPPAASVTLEVTSAEARPGQQLTIPVTLRTGGLEVAGVQNDITYPVAVMSLVGCEVNAAVGKDLTQFKFSLSGVRAVVLGANIDSIPDGAELYRCEVDVTPDAATGQYPLVAAAVVVIDPAGQPLPDVIGSNGVLFVRPLPLTPTPVAPAVRIDVVRANPGELVQVAVRLESVGASVAGTQNDIGFDGVFISIVAKPSGRPDCTVNPDIDKAATSFGFRPAGCADSQCVSVRAIVFSTANSDPIADGAVLYTCTVRVASDAAETVHPLVASNVVFSTPEGRPVPGATGRSGAIVVGPVDGHQPPGAPLPSAAATATAVPPSRTGAPTVTPTAASPQRSDAPVPQAMAAGDNGGCQIARPHASPLACVLLLLPLALLMLRRKTRSACAIATERQRPGVLMALVLSALVALAGVRPATGHLAELCAGDCNGDDIVTVDELITGINMALTKVPADSCPSFCDPICGPICEPPCPAVNLPTVTVLVRAVNNALHGCPGDGSRELRWFEGCGPPVVAQQPCPEDIGYCSGEQLGAPCAEFAAFCCLPGSFCTAGHCNSPLICRRTPVGSCPISRRRYKRDVAYLETADLTRLRDEVLAIKLATFRYRTEAAAVPPHLGFMIDDVEPSPSVDSRRDVVDLYGYTSMAVAAIQMQATEIKALQSEVEQLRSELRGSTAGTHPMR
ncbi:MAG: hypothetical protein ACE5I7_01850 [Candidatus Binatia bacterium]